MMTLTMGVVSLLILAGCQQDPSWRGQDVTGLMPDLAYELTDSTGARVRTEDLLGKVTLMYFGFTSCPDICPTTLSQIKVALQELHESRGVGVDVVRARGVEVGVAGTGDVDHRRHVEVDHRLVERVPGLVGERQGGPVTA